MDSFETINKYGTAFDSRSKFGKSVGLKTNLEGNFSRDEIESIKPLKYMTTSFNDKDMILNRGINFSEGFGTPASEIERSSAYRIAPLTHAKCIQELPAFPLATTANLSKGQGNTIVEDRIRPQLFRTLKACQPQDTEFYKRSFAIWDHLPIKPNGCVDNIVQKDNGHYMGVSTRRTNNYTQGKCGSIKKW